MDFLKRLFLLFLPLLSSCGHRQETALDYTWEYSTETYTAKGHHGSGWMLLSQKKPVEGAQVTASDEKACVEEVGEVCLDFTAKTHVDLNKARTMIVDTLLDFLKSLRPEVKDKRDIRFDIRAIDFLVLRLAFVDDNNAMHRNDEITFAFIKKGKVTYCVQGEDKLEPVHEETLEEATQTVEVEKIIDEKTHL